MNRKAVTYLARVGAEKLIGFLLYLVGARFAPSAPGVIYFCVLLAATAGIGIYLLPRSGDTLAARGRIRTDSPVWDKVLLGGFWLLHYFAVYWFAGREDSSRLPGPAFWVGLVLTLAAAWIITDAILSNPFLESTARLQRDRGQTIITGGPYSIVRHPTYSGILANCLGLIIIFPTPGAAICTGLSAVLIVIRTVMEDRMLMEGLPGYADYADTVRFRLIPHVW